MKIGVLGWEYAGETAGGLFKPAESILSGEVVVSSTWPKVPLAKSKG
jgi:hypothetical protein